MTICCDVVPWIGAQAAAVRQQPDAGAGTEVGDQVAMPIAVDIAGREMNGVLGVHLHPRPAVHQHPHAGARERDGQVADAVAVEVCRRPWPSGSWSGPGTTRWHCASMQRPDSGKVEHQILAAAVEVGGDHLRCALIVQFPPRRPVRERPRCRSPGKPKISSLRPLPSRSAGHHAVALSVCNWRQVLPFQRTQMPMPGAEIGDHFVDAIAVEIAGDHVLRVGGGDLRELGGVIQRPDAAGAEVDEQVGLLRSANGRPRCHWRAG